MLLLRTETNVSTVVVPSWNTSSTRHFAQSFGGFGKSKITYVACLETRSTRALLSIQHTGHQCCIPNAMCVLTAQCHVEGSVIDLFGLETDFSVITVWFRGVAEGRIDIRLSDRLPGIVPDSIGPPLQVLVKFPSSSYTADAAQLNR